MPGDEELFAGAVAGDEQHAFLAFDVLVMGLFVLVDRGEGAGGRGGGLCTTLFGRFLA